MSTIIHKLTLSQYDAITKDPEQFYLIRDNGFLYRGTNRVSSLSEPEEPVDYLTIVTKEQYQRITKDPNIFYVIRDNNFLYKGVLFISLSSDDFIDPILTDTDVLIQSVYNAILNGNKVEVY